MKYAPKKISNVPIIDAQFPKNYGLSVNDISERLEEFLVRIRAGVRLDFLNGVPGVMRKTAREIRQIVDEKLGEEAAQEIFETAITSFHEINKIRSRATRLHRRIIAATPSLRHLKDDDREEIKEIAAGVDLLGALDEHGVDERIAALHAESPWLEDVTRHVWRETRTRAAGGFHLRPVLLVGPPGCGKTHYLRRVAELFGVPHFRIDASIESSWVLGLEKGWSSSRPSEVVKVMVEKRCANPVIIIDEIDKAGGSYSERAGRIPSLTEKLLSVLEGETSKRWRDPYYGFAFDLTRVSFVFTANGVSSLPAPFLSRVRVIECREPQAADMPRVVSAAAAGRLDEEMVTMIAERVAALRGRGRSPSLREIRRAVDAAVAVADMPVMH